MNDNKVLYLIRGIPGSGKSTYAKSLNIPDHYEADMYFERNGAYKFDATKLYQAHSWCQRKTEEAMKANRPVVVSNTFVKKRDLLDYKNLAIFYRYKVIEKTMTGDYTNVHGVPADKVAQMKANFQP